MIEPRRSFPLSLVVLVVPLVLGATATGCFWDGARIRGSGYNGTPSQPKTPSRNPPAQGEDDDACFDASGFGGRGCFKCTPTTNDELLTACTTSRFETFDNELRIAGFDPSTPKPSIPDLGPTPDPFDPGASDPEPLPPAPSCDLSAKPNPVIVVGATGFPMESIAKAMGSAATIFYKETSSCNGVASIVLDQTASGEVVTWDERGSASRCTLDAPHPADIALSALFAGTCANQAGLAEPVLLPAGVQDFLGPVNAVMFATPATSKQRAISAEAAYRVYGFGNQSGVAPWTGEDLVFRRTASSGNQQTVALSLGLDAHAFRGRDSNGSSNVLEALRTSNEPERTIAISSSEIVDVNRDVMKALAYRHYDQPVAFYPDSDPASLDRRNVRDGHYFMWLPLHALTRTAGGAPIAATNAALDPDGSARTIRDATVKLLTYVMISRQQAPVRSVDLFGALKRVGNVPQCAMKVTRAKEGAPLEPWSPPVSCDCAFEAAPPGTTRPDCTPCNDSSECSSGRGTCSFGFCE